MDFKHMQPLSETIITSFESDGAVYHQTMWMSMMIIVIIAHFSVHCRLLRERR